MKKASTSKASSIIVLDCTFRDGGYYTNWCFEPNLVESYLTALASARVDVIEIGFRAPPQDSFMGPFAYSTDQFISNLNISSDLQIGVMINAKDFLDSPKELVAKVFAPKQESPVSIVRIAAHWKDIDQTACIVEALRKLGYSVCLNIMQIGGRSLESVTALTKSIKDWGTVEVLYLADSFGNMTPSDVKGVFSAVTSVWDRPLGMHTHDNMGLALANTLAAIEAGATWVDGTVLGMGRGAGNASTENILMELHRSGLRADVHPESLFPLVLDGFGKLKDKHKWGPHLLYSLGAQNNIHPSYIQEMLGDPSYDTHQIIQGLEGLSQLSNASSYSPKGLSSLVRGIDTKVLGTWDSTDWCKDRDVLLIGAGQGATDHAEGVMQFIEREKPLVLSLNVRSSIPTDNIDAYIACHRTRIAIDASRYRNLGKPLIIPRGLIAQKLLKSLDGISIYDYGVSVKEGSFNFGDTAATIPSLLVVPYALALATAGGARRILLAGFDGYGAGDPRQHEMESIIDLYKSEAGSIPLIAITPSSYGVAQLSVYAPWIPN